MNSQLKKIIIVLTLVCLGLTPILTNAQASPQVRLTAPTTIQAEVGKEFAIPMTITMGNNEGVVGMIWPIVEQTGINIEERTLNQILATNANMNVALRGTAQSAGLFRVSLNVDAAGFVYSTEVLVDVKDPDMAEKRPRFSVAQISLNPPKPESDMPFTLAVDLKNTGAEASGLVTVTINGMGNFLVQSITNRAEVPSIAAGETGKASFILKETEDRKSNELSLTLSYDDYTQTESLFLPLQDTAETLGPPSLKIESFTLEPTDQNNLILRLEVINEGSTNASNISVSLDGGTALFPSRGGSIRTITEILPGTKSTVEYPVIIMGALSGHPVNISFDFQDEDNKARKGSDIVFVSSDLEPSLNVTGFSAIEADSEGVFNLTINIRNTGRSAARDVLVRFTGNQATPLDKSMVFPISDIPAGESGRLSLTMQTRIESENFSLPFEITYRSIAGAEHTISDTIVLSADSIGVVTQDHMGIPHVALYRFTLSEDVVLADDEFTLTLFIKNTSDEKKDRTKITLGEARMSATGGSAFKTYDGQIAFFIESIPANSEVIQEIRLLADKNAQAAVYSLPIVIEYEDMDGKLSTINTSVSIPLRHEGRFRILTSDIPETASVGEAVPVSLEFANTGKVNLENMFISLEGDFNKETATFFIPSFAQGTSDFFHATLFPEIEGELTGKIVITYDDTDGSEIRVEHPFSLDVTAAPVSETGLPGNPRGFERARGTLQLIPWWIYVALAAVAVSIFAGVFIIKRTKRSGSRV